MGTMDLMAIETGPKLKDINRFGVKTREIGQSSVVILSMDPSNSSIKKFMKYIDNTHDVGSIMLQYVSIVNGSIQFFHQAIYEIY